MSNEEPTKDLKQEHYATQPTITAVLERINALGDTLTQNMKALEQKLIAEITEVASSVRRVERKIEVLNDNLLEVQADNRDFRDRLEQLESRAS